MDDYNADEYRRYYELCVSIVQLEKAGISLRVQKESLEVAFTSEYMHLQIDTLSKSRETNPTEAIGKPKELIKSCCKTIFEERKVLSNKRWTITQLIKETMKCLRIETDALNANLPVGDTVKRILSGLGNIAGGIAELRNSYGTGHGKSDSFKGLTIQHVKLGVGRATALVEYLWDAHKWKNRANENQ